MSSSDSEDKIDLDRVVIEQTLLKVDETFVYKVPPMATSTGFRAEDWNLANPIASCSLLVNRIDSALAIQLYTDRAKEDGPPGATEKHLFAKCIVRLNLTSDKPQPKMDYWVDAVVDSSRYFVIRISDEESGREAHIGMGFRERNDALDFKMSLDDYAKTMKKEAIIENSHMDQSGWKDDGSLNSKEGEGEETGDNVPALEVAASKLSLKAGEKIHLNIKGADKKGRKKASITTRQKPIMLLKPPPSEEIAMDPIIKETAVVDPTVKDSMLKINCEVGDEDADWGDFESFP
eukprot:scaffold3686_cov228-Chaetoceros_neogracile.AAC.5